MMNREENNRSVATLNTTSRAAAHTILEPPSMPTDEPRSIGLWWDECAAKEPQAASQAATDRHPPEGVGFAGWRQLARL
jgi:hypothetical protein